MATAPNPYAIDIAQSDLSPVMEGIGSLVKSSRDAAKKERANVAIREAITSGDPAKMAEIALEYPDYAKSASAAFGFTNNATKKHAMTAYTRVLSDPTNAAKYLQDGIDSVTEFGGTPSMMRKDLALMQENPQAALKAIEAGFASADPKAYKALMSGGDPDFLKEERKSASQDVRAFNTQAKTMRTSYGQLQGLAEQAASGDRGARNAMTVTLARLISPGIVTEAEAAGLSGGQSIMQYVLEKATTGNSETDNILKSLDPYGQSFNADAMLNIGNSIVASGKQPLIDMYEGSKDRATRAKMGKRAFNTNFGSNANYDFLSGFDSGVPDVSEIDAPKSTPSGITYTVK